VTETGTNKEAPTKQTSGKNSPRRGWRFWLLVTLLVLVVVPVLLVAAVLLVLRSETGTAWAIDQIPGLRVEGDSGSLFGYWQADTVRWQGYGTGLDLDAVVIDWSPGCLLRKQLCLDTLQAEAIRLRLQPSSEPGEPRQDISLPLVNLPVGLRIGDVQLGEFTIDGSSIWDQLELKASGSGTDWNLSRAVYRLGEMSVDASGRLETRGPWPLDLDVNVDLPPPEGDQWQIALNLTGSAEDLRVTGRSEGYLDARVQGRAAPLQAHLPARLMLQSDAFLALETLPPTLTLENWQLSLDGSLNDGFATRSSAELPGTAGPVRLSLVGDLTTTGASGVTLEMTGPEQDSSTGTLVLSGDVSWAEALSADGNLQLEAFPWYTLLPDVEQPPVDLRSLAAELNYSDGRYQASLEADVSGPMGEAALSTALTGDLASVSLTELGVSTGAGSLTGQADIGFAEQVTWDAGLTLDAFNPGYWLPALEANLNGELNSQRRLADDGQPELTADWDIAGRWRKAPAETRGRLEAGGGAWLVSELTGRLGTNRIDGSGRWGEALAGNFQLNLPDPGLLVPGLAGTLSASLHVTGGTPDNPEGSLTLSGSELAWQDTAAVAEVALDATLSRGRQLDARVRAQAIRSGDQTISELALGLTGDQQDHRLTVTAVHEEAELAMAFSGGAGDDWNSWQGALEEGEIDLIRADQVWRLDQPAALDYGKDGSLALGAHCWRWQDSSVCAEDQTLLPDPSVAYRIDNLPASVLGPLLPETLRWTASIDADIQVAMTDQGPDGEITIDAGAGAFEILALEEWETLRHDVLAVKVGLKPDVADVEVRLAGPELGDLGVNLSVDPREPDRPVTGNFSLRGLDIALAGVIAGLEEVQGELNGEGRLSGPLMKPAVNGEVALTGGRFVDPTIPLPLDDVVIALELNGYSADLSGRWTSNDRSNGRLDGSLEWENQPAVDVTISGQRLPVTYDPYARVEVAPDITVSFRDGALSVSGQVEVPRGEIEVRTLPEQAVSVSEDEVIVGAEPEETAVQALNMDVTVVVGEDEVTFAAFGVTGDLEGTLRIGNDMDTRGSLQLVDGQYEAYGQELELRRARIVFVGPLSEPYLDIEAIRRVDNVVAGIRLSGPVSEPETEVFSEPSMPQSDALSYVILGRSPQSRGEEGQMSQAALSLGLTQASKVTQGLGNELGIRNLTLEAEGSGDEASVVASGYITDELSLRYGVGIFEPITTVALRYDLGRYFYLEAASGLAASLDIFYTRDF